MTHPGNPTSYKPGYCALAHNYCLLGATNEELGRFFGVTRRTIDNWIATIPEFAAAVRDGKTVANAKVVRALYDRAIGYRLEAERTYVYRGQEKKVSDTVRYPPDTQACIFWLRNRCPDDWSGRPERLAEEPVEDDDVALVAELSTSGESMRHVDND